MPGARDELAGDSDAPAASALPSESNEWTGAAGSSGERLLDHRRDLEEPQATAEERVHRHLVGGVQRARGGAAGDRGLARQPQAAKRVLVAGSNVSEPSSTRSSGRTGTSTRSG